MSNYPPGAELDPNAPYNQPDDDDVQEAPEREPEPRIDEWDVQDWQDGGIDW